jgi:uncharacterized protein (TIGR00255 family)
MRSMTGFGTASLQSEGLEASATVRSVNHRFLDLSVHLSRRLAALEPDVRKAVQAKLARGKVEVSLVARFGDEKGEGVRASEALVGSLVATLRALKETHRLAGDVTVSDLARFPGALESLDAASALDDARRQRLLGLLGEALEGAFAMSLAEGASLRRELQGCLDQIAAAAERMQALSEQSRAERVAALEAKVRELAAAAALDEGRLHQEVVRLVERGEIAEELARLRSHVAQCREAVADSAPSGRRLDFLAQELGREANTVGSKAASAALIHEVVALKGAIERLREQVQNVE